MNDNQHQGKIRFTFRGPSITINQATNTVEEYDLLQCIDKALDAFGSSVKNAIFLRLTMQHNSSRNEVISDPSILARVIEESFGNSATGIERSIIKELRKKFAITSKGVRSLVEAINDAKAQIVIAYA